MKKKLIAWALALCLLAGLLPAGVLAAGENPFTDVSSTDYFADAVLWALERGITTGTSSTQFSPEASCTRAQVVTFLWRALGKPQPTGTCPFTDVSASQYYHDAVLWAAENGVTTGTSAITFSPEDVVTRAQVVTFLWRALNQPKSSGSNDFSDVAANQYYYQAVLWAAESGVTKGTGAGCFSPDQSCLRGQTVTFLYRALWNTASEPMEPTEPTPTEPQPTEPTPTEPQPTEPLPTEPEPTEPVGEEPAAPNVPAAMEKHSSQGLGYWLYTPENPSGNMPLLVYLHGGSGKGEELDQLLNIDGFPKWLYDGGLGAPSAYILIPQLPSSQKGWSDSGSSVIALIDELAAEYGLDTSNVSLTGHSMGGTGTFALAKAYPDTFVRIAPCSGSIRITDEELAVFQNIAVWAFVGSADTIVDPKSSIYFVDRLSQIGNAKLTQFEGATHFDVPALVYLNSEINIIDWLIAG